MVTKVIKSNLGEVSIHKGGSSPRGEFYGKAGDVKPTEGVKNADIFYEMDTKKGYLFDEETGTWLEQ